MMNRPAESTVGFDRTARPSRTRALGLAGAGAAATVAVAMTAETQAAIVASGVQNITVNESSPFELDIDNDTNAEFDFTASGSGKGAGADVNPDKSGAAFLVDSSGDYPAQLTAGELIGGTGDFEDFQTQITTPDGTPPWDPAGDTGFMGIKFDLTGNTHFGWIEITSISGTEIVINQWAYEDQPNVGIEAGVIPEPTTGLLLGTVLTVGALTRGKRRQSRA